MHESTSLYGATGSTLLSGTTLYEAPQHRRRPSAFVAAEEDPSYGAHCDLTDRPLDGIVINCQIAVIAIRVSALQFFSM